MTFDDALSTAKQIANDNKRLFKDIGEKQAFVYNAANAIHYNSIGNKKANVDNATAKNIEAYASTIKSFISNQNVLNEDIKKVYIAYVDSITNTLLSSIK